MVEYQKCLGKACRWFRGKADSRCFFNGVLPECSPKLKAEMKQLLSSFIDPPTVREK